MTNRDNPSEFQMSGLPLAGVKVVELGQNLAGPFASAILSSMGADVVKIERPEGDDARGWGPPFWRNTATTFQAVNHGKRSVVLDLKDPEAIEWLKSFLGDADVLIQNLRPGVMDKLGLGPDELMRLNPALIYCSLWAFGAKGPMHLKPGYEPIIQAFSGMFSVNGTDDGPPSRVGMQVLDLGTGTWAALGTLAALYQRHTTGRGCVVDTSLLETALGWMSVLFAGFNATGVQPPRHRTGNPRVVVFQSFAVSDGEVVVAAANDRLFAKLAQALGHPEWATDSRYRTNALRVENKKELLPQIEKVFMTESMAHWSDCLDAVGVPCSPVHDFEQIVAQPQTEALGIFQEIPDLDLRVVGLPVSFDGQRPPVVRKAPELGEHSIDLMAPPARVDHGQETKPHSSST